MDDKPREKKNRPGILTEYIYFLKVYKMWWLFPVFMLILVLGLVVLLGGSEVALTIYALF